MDQFIHPEIKEGEVFFGNMSYGMFNQFYFKQKRIGNIAYDGKGNKLDDKNWYPVFIKKEDVVSKHIMELRRMWYGKFSIT